MPQRNGIRRSKDLRAEIGKFPNSTNERKQMSIMTLRKRISLTAVVALAAGTLSVAVVPTANAAWTAPITVAGAGVSGTSTICLTGTPSAATTPRYMAVNSYQGFTTTGTATSTATAVITGPAKWVTSVNATSALEQDTISADGKTITSSTGSAAVIKMQFTGVGQVVVSASDYANSSTNYFIAVASCDGAVSLADSYFQLRSDTNAATSNINVSAGSTVQYSTSGTQKSYIAMDLNDAYGTAVDTTSLALTATVTGGCTVSWDATAAAGTTIAVDTGASNDTENLVILNDNTPRSCSVVVTLGSVTIGTKTVSFRGDVASIAIDPANTKGLFAFGEAGSSSSTALNANSIVYVAKDSAGNIIVPSALPAITTNTNGFEQATIANGDYSYTAMVTNGYATLDLDASAVSASRRGVGTYAIKLTRQSDGQSVTSQTVTASITSTLYTFESAWDKASYSTGDIMTLTITGKDIGGRLVHDGALLAGVVVAVGGSTASVTPAGTDAFSKGVKSYKYIAGVTSGNYGWSVSVTSGSGQDNLVGTFKITDSTTAVSNADVLKSIVALIASINKQIQALQKLILKR